MVIYERCGYTQEDAAEQIITKILFGLDIDKRAFQLAYFTLLMKARQYNRRILSVGIRRNLYFIRDSSILSAVVIDQLFQDLPTVRTDLFTLAEDLRDATCFGSIIDVTMVD
ncbi:MAG TPA: restriction endonuclease, partial [Clostridiaceae bacterium]|nr:restriction endonuclease [Clostridiaceae bacterium]